MDDQKEQPVAEVYPEGSAARAYLEGKEREIARSVRLAEYKAWVARVHTLAESLPAGVLPEGGEPSALTELAWLAPHLADALDSYLAGEDFASMVAGATVEALRSQTAHARMLTDAHLPYSAQPPSKRSEETPPVVPRITHRDREPVYQQVFEPEAVSESKERLLLLGAIRFEEAVAHGKRDAQNDLASGEDFALSQTMYGWTKGPDATPVERAYRETYAVAYRARKEESENATSEASQS